MAGINEKNVFEILNSESQDPTALAKNFNEKNWKFLISESEWRANPEPELITMCYCSALYTVVG